MRSYHSVGVKLCIASGSICKESDRFSAEFGAFYDAFGGIWGGFGERRGGGGIYSASTSRYFSDSRDKSASSFLSSKYVKTPLIKTP